jgi:hypothetical protein
MTGFIRWRSAEEGFADWELRGVTRDATNHTLQIILPPGTQQQTDPYPPGAYDGGNFYNGSQFYVGEALSPVVATAEAFVFTEAIASWNADTPPGTWIETLIRARVGDRWTKWYNLGVWALGTETVQRHSVSEQGDADGYVATDTLVLAAREAAAGAFQIKVRLFSADGVETPVVRNMSVAYSTAAPKKTTLSTGNSANWGASLTVPECSQMVYPDGGEVWCSPTSVSMVLDYWKRPAAKPCEPGVLAAVAGIYDWIYHGTGNWPFNTGYAASLGYEGYVARFSSLAQAEEWVAAGVPVVVSFAWGVNDLAGAAIPSSNGHLAVLVGFDAAGNPIVNDPAAATDAEVQRTYDRAQFEAQWLTTSGGTVYLIYPADHATPGL